jgi:23S rRNA pseudouridine2605 synthase
MTRLSVYIQQTTGTSRRKSDVLIAEGRVTVNENICTQPFYQVVGSDRIALDGERIKSKVRKPELWCLYKPKGMLVTKDDPQGRQTIFELESVQKLGIGYNTIGRLDYASEGLLLITNNGQWHQELAHPSHNIEKEYWVRLDKRVDKSVLDKITAGTELEEGTVVPVALETNQDISQGYWIKIVITVGWNRVVRRIFEMHNYSVQRLVRTRVGNIAVGALKPGELQRVPYKKVAG